MSEERDHLTEADARRIWRRAAELQAQAAERLEARSEALAGDETQDVAGYALAHVRQAAVEAGIAPEFIEEALAEMDRGVLEARPQPSRYSRIVLGPMAPQMSVSRVIDASPDEVYAAMQRIFPGAPYALSLVDIRGPHPLEGGVMIFEVPAPTLGGEGGNFRTDLHFWGDVRELRVQIRSLGADAARCEVTAAAPLDRSWRVNTVAGTALIGLVTVLSGIGGVAALGLAGLAVPPVFALAGGAGWRALHRFGLRRGRSAVARLLNALSGDLRTGGAFSQGAGGLPAHPGVRTDESGS